MDSSNEIHVSLQAFNEIRTKAWSLAIDGVRTIHLIILRTRFKINKIRKNNKIDEMKIYADEASLT